MAGALTMTIHMSVASTATALGARAINGDAVFHGVSTDSRHVAAGELFVALKGETFDGHDFVASVASRGAAAALVSHVVPAANLPQIVVGDTTLALGRLAQHWRSRFTLPVLALTGSNGKTTVKEMLRAILIAHTGDANAIMATEGNLNNHIGLPLMLLKLAAPHRYAVLEMGMNHRGEIDYLARLATPAVALVTVAGTAHIGELGSREAIAQAKGEIYAALPEHGIACINADDAYAPMWHELAGNRRVIRFGTAADAEVRGILGVNGVELVIAGQRVTVRLKVIGEHNQRNAIAAAAGAYALGIPLEPIQRGLEQFQGSPGRLRVYEGMGGATIIDDTYNANPDSMRAAIAVLAAKKGTRILVLGDMKELGAEAKNMHHEIGIEARKANIHAVFGLGELARGYVQAFGQGAQHFDSVEALSAALTPQLSASTTVLVKGSRSMKMERVVEKIAHQYVKDIH